MTFKNFCEKMEYAFTNGDFVEVEVCSNQFKLWFDINSNGIPEVNIHDDKATIDFDEGFFEFSESSFMEIEESYPYITFVIKSDNCKVEIDTILS